MRFHVLISLIVLLYACNAVNSLSAAVQKSPSEIFEMANQAYQNGSNKEAAELYQALINQGYLNASLWYNLGNTYARTGKKGMALVMYERARRLAPRDPDLLKNIEIISSSAGRKKSFILLRPFSDVLNYFTSNELFLSVEIFYALICIMLIARLLKPSPFLYRFIGKMLKPAAIIFLAVFCLFAVKLYGETVVISGIVIEDKTISRSGPGDEFTEIMALPECTKFRLLEHQDNGWAKIQIPGGRTGFIPSPAFEII